MNPGGHEIPDTTDLIGKYVTFIYTNGIVVAGVCVERVDIDPETGPRVRYTLPGNAGQSAVPLSAVGFLYVHHVRKYDDFVLPSMVHAGPRAKIREGAQ
jgi:hypothetical protein